MSNLATLYAQCSLIESQALKPSRVQSFLASKEFGDWCKTKEAEQKNTVTQIQCLNEVIKGLSNVCKAIQRKRF